MGFGLALGIDTEACCKALQPLIQGHWVSRSGFRASSARPLSPEQRNIPETPGFRASTLRPLSARIRALRQLPSKIHLGGDGVVFAAVSPRANFFGTDIIHAQARDITLWDVWPWSRKRGEALSSNVFFEDTFLALRETSLH